MALKVAGGSRRLNIAGHRFGRWLVLTRDGRERASWLCRCDCGTEKVVAQTNLRKGVTESCGCLRREITAKRFTSHGDTGSPEYQAWAGAIKRCGNPRCQDYPNYGGRWIRVCNRWKSFEAFLADMGRKPGPKYSLDRINNDGNYEPGNCRWATPLAQVHNRRRVRRVASPITVNEILAAHGLVF